MRAQASPGDRQPEQRSTHSGSRPHEPVLRRTHPYEWIVATISGGLVVLLIAVILYEAASANGKPPELVTRIEGIEATAGGHRVSFVAINQGGSTAAGAKIEGSLKNGNRTLETADVTLDYVPAHSERRGALLFERDPNEYQLQISAKGYVDP